MYILVRKEKHIDDRYWEFDNFKDAKDAAYVLINYWESEYNDEDNRSENIIIDEENLFVYQAEPGEVVIEVSEMELWVY